MGPAALYVPMKLDLSVWPAPLRLLQLLTLGLYGAVAGGAPPADGILEVGKDQIRYSGGVTGAEASALATALQDAGYFTNAGIAVMLRKGPEGRPVIGYVVMESRWRPDLLLNYESITRSVAPALGGLPLRIKILTGELDTLTESNVWPPVRANEKDKVHASGMATMDDGQTLAKALTDNGFLQNLGVNVFLFRNSTNGVIISIPTNQNEKALGLQMPAFEFVMRDIAGAVGGLPLRLRMVDFSSLEIRRDLQIHPALRYGKSDLIFRSDAATRGDADALAAVLRTEGLFTDEEVSVLLSKNNAGAMVSIIVKKGAWDKDEVVKYYRELGYKMAPAIGGLPIRMRLLSTDFEVKKDLEIR